MNIDIQSTSTTERIIITDIIRPEHLSEIKQLINSLPKDKDKQIYIDSSQVCKFSVSDTCFTTYISLLLQLRTDKVELVLFGASTLTERLLKLLKLEGVFKVVPSLEEALISQQEVAEV